MYRTWTTLFVAVVVLTEALYSATIAERATYASVLAVDLKSGPDISFSPRQRGIVWNAFGDGASIQVAWPDVGSTIAFFAIDRNANGLIDEGRELFGAQTYAGAITGFAALAAIEPHDGNGAIDSGDRLYRQLLLWSDLNRDAKSQPDELRPASDVFAKVGLGYLGVNRRDRNGNRIRFEGWAIRHVDVLGAGPDKPWPVYEVTLDAR